MKNKILLSLSLIIVASLLVLVGVLIERGSDDLNDGVEIVDIANNESVETSTLESGFYNFRITYPKHLVLGASSILDTIGSREIVLVDESTVLWETDKPSDGIVIDVLFNFSQLALDDFVNNVVSSSRTLDGDIIKWNKEVATINGKSAIKITPVSPDWKKNQGNQEIYIESPTFGSSHIIKITELNAGDNTFDEVFQQIISSFEFTN